ncbi:MAG: hypothetical protein FWF25_05425 [Propionibacteriaceae bacterium]|nr:hypothetical protein [Propionibacteriaceae bacterium]
MNKSIKGLAAVTGLSLVIFSGGYSLAVADDSTQGLTLQQLTDQYNYYSQSYDSMLQQKQDDPTSWSATSQQRLTLTEQKIQTLQAEILADNPDAFDTGQLSSDQGSSQALAPAPQATDTAPTQQSSPNEDQVILQSQLDNASYWNQYYSAAIQDMRQNPGSWTQSSKQNMFTGLNQYVQGIESRILYGVYTCDQPSGGTQCTPVVGAAASSGQSPMDQATLQAQLNNATYWGQYYSAAIQDMQENPASWTTTSEQHMFAALNQFLSALECELLTNDPRVLSGGPSDSQSNAAPIAVPDVSVLAVPPTNAGTDTAQQPSQVSDSTPVDVTPDDSAPADDMTADSTPVADPTTTSTPTDSTAPSAAQQSSHNHGQSALQQEITQYTYWNQYYNASPDKQHLTALSQYLQNLLVQILTTDPNAFTDVNLNSGPGPHRVLATPPQVTNN